MPASKKAVCGGSAQVDKAGIEQARLVIERGGVVAFPTESFYGLAVDIRREDAIRKLFRVKGRSPDQPVLLILPSFESVKDYAAVIPPAAGRLMDRFWPGGLTLVFRAAASVNPILSAGTGSIGLRLSGHAPATRLALAVGTAISGTSANPSGYPPACTAEEVKRSMGHALDLILDGGRTPGGPGSTVLDVTLDPPRILRHGQVDRESLERCLNVKLTSSGPGAPIP